MPPVTGLTITNPLVLYRSLLAAKAIEPDVNQHRLALHLQKLYIRLKDYSPQSRYGARLEAVSRAVGRDEDVPGSNLASPGHPLRNNPLFSRFFAPKVERNTRALVKVLSGHDAAKELDSPKGLLLYGEVGSGKSMLVDLLADSLPSRYKRRWHFNTFMLETFSRLESLRQSREATGYASAEHSLLWLARDMIEKTPILFLDEFQLPDRSTNKILSHLFTIFFQLGGVLLATSYRMPDELSRASGTDSRLLPRVGNMRKFLGYRPNTYLRGRAAKGWRVCRLSRGAKGKMRHMGIEGGHGLASARLRPVGGGALGKG
jgi:protein AFG1